MQGCFNSITVQLRQIAAEADFAERTRFNSITVQLRQRRSTRNDKFQRCFNSITVQLRLFADQSFDAQNFVSIP